MSLSPPDSPVAAPFRYYTFGLSIDSRIPLPELCVRQDADPPQVEIDEGTLPSGNGDLFNAGPGLFLLSMRGVAQYMASGGTDIKVDIEAGADQESVRLFLLGSVLGALLHQRGLLPLHASAIETAKGAVLFAGTSGTGKSALAAAFHARGYRVLADEICVVDSSSIDCPVLPAFPRLLLWPDVIEQLGLSGPHVRPVRPKLRKHHVPLTHGFAHGPVPLHSIYIPRFTNAGGFDLSRVAGARKIRKLIEITFRRQFLAGMVPDPEYFGRINAVARRAAVSRMGRPFGFTLQETADLLEKDFAA